MNHRAEYLRQRLFRLKQQQQQQEQQQPFYGPLSGTTRVSRYQKKHSPTHHPDHHPIFISFESYRKMQTHTVDRSHYPDH